MRRWWAALLLLLAACNRGPVPSSGTVRNTDHDPGYVSMLVVSIKPYTVIPIYYPESWSLQVEDCDPPPCFRGWVDVDEDVYRTHPIGTQWP